MKTKSTKHTPGPWKIQIGNYANTGQIFIEGQEQGNHFKQHVAKLGYAFDKNGNDVREANAKLIEVAPELFEVCKALLEAYAPNAGETAAKSGENTLHSSVKAAREIIAKVESPSRLDIC